MMKVCVLSMHRIINYGSFLQAYALKQLLLQNGAEQVSFIDIKPGKHLKGWDPTTLKYRLGRLWYFIRLALQGRLVERMQDKKHFHKIQACLCSHYRLLEIDESPAADYQLAVIGSDEVFNCCQISQWGYTPQLYGDIPEADRVISYAGSFGHTQYEQLVSLGIDREIGQTLKSVSAISVRDQNSVHIVHRLTGIRPHLHLDPVLIYGYSREIEQAPRPALENYIVVYAYHGRIHDKAEIQAIRNFAAAHKKTLVSFTYYAWCDQVIVPSTPFDVFAWFRQADYVITDTFHGTIFSVITRRPFATLIRPSNRNKITSLLESLCLSEKGIYDPAQLAETLTAGWDQTKVEQILTAERKRSNDFLSSVLQQ